MFKNLSPTSPQSSTYIAKQTTVMNFKNKNKYLTDRDQTPGLSNKTTKPIMTLAAEFVVAVLTLMAQKKKKLAVSPFNPFLTNTVIIKSS